MGVRVASAERAEIPGDTGPVTVIFHIARRREWEAAVAKGEYRRSTRDASLEEVGFIHCSTASQVAGVAERFYADEAEPLVLLTIDVDRLDVEVVHENLDGGSEQFPHIYGPLATQAVVRVEDLTRAADGRLLLPTDLAARG